MFLSEYKEDGGGGGGVKCSCKHSGAFFFPVQKRNLPAEKMSRLRPKVDAILGNEVSSFASGLPL